MNKTKLFFVVDSQKRNEEIFETLEGAIEYFKGIEDCYKNKEREYEKGLRCYIALVKNYYYDDELESWTYNDLSDTFKFAISVNLSKLSINKN